MTFPVARPGAFFDPDPSQTNNNAADLSDFPPYIGLGNGGGACAGIGIGSKQVWDEPDFGPYPQPFSTPNDLTALQRRIGEDAAAVGGPSMDGQDVEFQPSTLEFITVNADIAPDAVMTPGTAINRTGQTIFTGQSAFGVTP